MEQFPRNIVSTGISDLSLSADRQYRWHASNCAGESWAFGRARLKRGKLILRPEREEGKSKGPTSLHLRRFAGRSILLEEDEVEQFDFLPSLSRGLVEILPADSGDEVNEEEEELDALVRARFGEAPRMVSGPRFTTRVESGLASISRFGGRHTASVHHFAFAKATSPRAGEPPGHFSHYAYGCIDGQPVSDIHSLASAGGDYQ